MGYRKAPHHRGPHQRIARHVVTTANNNPNQTCPRCGLSRIEGINLWGEQGEWEAGHRIDGNSAGGYQAEHRHCNRSAGATLGNTQREPHSGWLKRNVPFFRG